MFRRGRVETSPFTFWAFCVAVAVIAALCYVILSR